MTDLISIESTPASLSINFDEVKAKIQEDLKKYDVVVTEDTVKDSRAMAAELNKKKDSLSKKRKAAIEQVSAPIKLFESQIKELEQMCEDARQAVTSQIKKFDDKKREASKEVLAKELAILFSEQGVREEFQKSPYEDLVSTTALTKTGNLTSAVYGKLRARVAENKALQDRTDKRLILLENESLKAGLAAPLTRAHVETFLFDDDEGYQAKLAVIFESELEREKIAKDKAREQYAQPPVAEVPAHMKEQPPIQEPHTVDISDSAEIPAPVPGQITIDVSCVFRTSVDPSIPDEAIVNELKKVLAAANITTLTSVTVNRLQQEVA